MTDLTKPMVMTDRQNAGDPAMFKRRGINSVCFQVQNDAYLHDYDFAPYKDVGLSCSVWGVTYKQENFRRDGRLLGEQAVKLGADHVVMDAEECAKFTRADRGLKKIVDGIREHWDGAVSLSTLGAPSNWQVNDFEIDHKSFLDTGGFVIPQAYANDHAEYDPLLCALYWQRVGVPQNRLNLTISLVAGDTSKIRWGGNVWAPLLQKAGLGTAWSTFLSYSGTEEDYAALQSVRVYTAADYRQEMIAAGRAAVTQWRALGYTEERIAAQRITKALVALGVTP